MPSHPQKTSENARRNFLKTMAVAPVAGLVTGDSHVPGHETATHSEQTWKRPDGPLVGIQIGPHSIFDESVDHCLDLLKRTAGINALFVYSHTYYAAGPRPPEALAHDHGVKVRDLRERTLPKVWVRHNEERFKGTIL